MDLARLRSAEGAAFDSHVDEFDARCHEGTREQLLCEIREWAEDERGKCIFWLNGMAGTGKALLFATNSPRIINYVARTSNTFSK